MQTFLFKIFLCFFVEVLLAAESTLLSTEEFLRVISTQKQLSSVQCSDAPVRLQAVHASEDASEDANPDGKVALANIVFGPEKQPIQGMRVLGQLTRERQGTVLHVTLDAVGQDGALYETRLLTRPIAGVCVKGLCKHLRGATLMSCYDAAQSMPLLPKEFLRIFHSNLPVHCSRAPVRFQEVSMGDVTWSDEKVELACFAFGDGENPTQKMHVMGRLTREFSQESRGYVLRLTLEAQGCAIANYETCFWSRPIPGFVGVSKCLETEVLKQDGDTTEVLCRLPYCSYSNTRENLMMRSEGRGGVTLEVVDAQKAVLCQLSLDSQDSRYAISRSPYTIFEPMDVLRGRMFSDRYHNAVRIFCLEQDPIVWSSEPVCLAVIVPNGAKSFDSPGVYRVEGFLRQDAFDGLEYVERVLRIIGISECGKAVEREFAECVRKDFITILPGFGPFIEKNSKKKAQALDQSVALIMPYAATDHNGKTFMELSYEHPHVAVKVFDEELDAFGERGHKFSYICGTVHNKTENPSWLFVQTPYVGLGRDTRIFNDKDVTSFVRKNFSFNVVWNEHDPCPLVRVSSQSQAGVVLHDTVLCGEFIQHSGGNVMLLFLCDISFGGLEGGDYKMARVTRQCLEHKENIFLKPGMFVGNQNVAGFKPYRYGGMRSDLPCDIRSEDQYSLVVQKTAEGVDICVLDRAASTESRYLVTPGGERPWKKVVAEEVY